ncbi:protein kinase, partial [bacterium]|nr:protein kinase [bacterium]
MRIGNYEMVSELGRGGMGIVFLARSPEGRDVAIKVMKAGASRDSLARFQRERRLQTSLGEAEGFVPLLDAGDARQPTGASFPYIVMPYLPGGSLRERLFAGPLGLDQAERLARALAAALAAAHERGVVHRDLKPENVLFTEDGRALVADLGLAKHFDADGGGASSSIVVSKTGAALGTFGYSSPEQLADSKHAGPAADVFAFGAILYESLTGKPAFEGSSLSELIAKVLAGSYVPVAQYRPDAPSHLRHLVERALVPDVGARMKDGRELARALGVAPPGGTSSTTILQPSPLLAAETAKTVLEWSPLLESAAPRATSAAGARRKLVVLAVVLGVAAAAAGATAVFRSAPSDADERSRLRATELVASAEAKQKKGDHAGAIGDTTKAIELDPRLARAWSIRGDARSKTGDRPSAIADCSRAIELDPKLASAWTNRGAARSRHGGDPEGAIADFDRAIELDATFAEAWASRGTARAETGDLDRAIRDCSRAVELDP